MRLHPAVLIAGAFVLGSAGREIWPITSPAVSPATLQHLGSVLIVAGMVTAALGYLMLARFRQPIDPRKETTRLVTAGIYRLSRNPIYVGWFLLLVGAGLENRSLFQIVTAVALLGLLRWAVIGYEERALLEKFGVEYQEYQERVRRWL